MIHLPKQGACSQGMPLEPYLSIACMRLELQLRISEPKITCKIQNGANHDGTI